MTNFLSDANKEKLAEMLRETDCPEDIIKHMTEVSEQQADDWMQAHAKVCIDAEEGKCDKRFLGLSAMCMMVMAEEAQQRGWGTDRFPVSMQTMKKYLALQEQETDKNQTRH